MTNEEKLAQAMGVPSSIEQVTIGAYQINYLVAGAGSPLLLIHGANIGWGMWYTTIAALSKQFKVYAIDLPGSGGSTKIDFARADLEKDYVDVVEEFIRGKELAPVAIVGHSFGGWIALRLVMRAAVPVSKVVLVNSLGFTRFLRAHHRLASIRPLAHFLTKTALSPTREHMRSFLAEPFFDKAFLTDIFFNYFYEGVHRFALAHPLLFIHSLSSLFRLKRELDLSATLGSVIQPVLIMWGEHDKTVPLRRSALMFHRFRNAAVEIFKDCGHVPPLEKGELFTAKLRAFLNS